MREYQGFIATVHPFAVQTTVVILDPGPRSNFPESESDCWISEEKSGRVVGWALPTIVNAELYSCRVGIARGIAHHR